MAILHPPRQTSPDDPDGFAWAAADGPAEAGGEYEDRGGDRVRGGRAEAWVPLVGGQKSMAKLVGIW